jgi:hypothetical protein
MKVIITPNELFDLGLWLEYCELTSTNQYAINEGLMPSDTELPLTIDQAKKLGIIEYLSKSIC